MRLFVALTPPPGVLDELDAACAPLRAGREDLRWTGRETWHLTLAFLGEVGELPLTRRPDRARWQKAPSYQARSGLSASPGGDPRTPDAPFGRGLIPRLERGARRHRAFELALSGAGAFSSPRRATVLWTGLAGDRKALGDLAATVSAAARRAGAPPPDTRQFRPHLTLARCRRPADLQPLVIALSDFQSAPWTAHEIQLIRSHLPEHHHEAPRYETLGAWPLRTG